MQDKQDMSPHFMELDDCWNRQGVWGQGQERCTELDRYGHCHNCPVFSHAARRLLDRDIPDAYANEWAAVLASPKEFQWSNPYSSFVFRIGPEWLAFPSSIIREVIARSRIHKIPHRREPMLKGLVNVRGKLEICISVGAVLGIRPAAMGNEQNKSSERERLIVAEREGFCVAFPVSEVKGIVHYDIDRVADPPVSVTGAQDAYTGGILKIDGIEVGIIDEKLFFQTVKRGLA